MDNDFKNNEEIFFMQGLSEEDMDDFDTNMFDFCEFSDDDFKSYDITDTSEEIIFDEDFIKSVKADNKTVKNKTNKRKTNSKTKSVHGGHRERMRDKFLKYGFEVFSEVEVLEYLLYYCLPQKNTNEIAHKLIDNFGSLKGVLNAEYFDLMEVAGIKEYSAAFIVMYRELFKYVRTNNDPGIVLSKSEIAGKFCCDYFYNHVEESFILISLDSNKKVKCVDVISKGTETETAFYARKIIKYAVKNRANAVIFAHNHPGENPQPSSNDLIITDRFIKILESLGIDLIDHIICSGNKNISISDKGLM